MYIYLIIYTRRHHLIIIYFPREKSCVGYRSSCLYYIVRDATVDIILYIYTTVQLCSICSRLSVVTRSVAVVGETRTKKNRITSASGITENRKIVVVFFSSQSPPLFAYTSHLTRSNMIYVYMDTYSS